MNEKDVYRLLLARSEHYDITDIEKVRGRAYTLKIKGEKHSAVLLPTSFDFYEKRYFLLKTRPDLIICMKHDTVLPVTVLSLGRGNLAEPYDKPEDITDVAEQRITRLGRKVLIGMYLSGLEEAQDLVKDLPRNTRDRYMKVIEKLGKRRRGKPLERS